MSGPGYPRVLAIVLFLWLFFSISAPAAEIRGIWSTLPPVPSPRQEVAFDVLDGKLYIIGGIGGDSAVEAFNSETGDWEELPDLPRGLHHGSAAAVGGKIYSIGGFASGGPIFGTPLAEVFEFDPSRASWEARAPLPSPRGGLMSLALNGLIYAIGGRDQSNSFTNVDVFDPDLNAWSPAASLPVPLDHLAAAMVDGRIYVAGGRLTQNGSFIRNDPTLVVYDPSSDQWRLGPDLPTSRSGHAAASIAGFLLVMGGEIPGVLNANEVYDPANSRWFRLDDLPTARHGMGIGVINNRVLTAAGGLIAGLAPSGVSEAFDVLSVVESLAQFASGAGITSQLVLSNPGERAVQFRFELHSTQQGQELEVSLNGQRSSIFGSEIEPGGLKIFTSDPVIEPVILTGAVTLYSDGPLVSNVLFSGPQGFAGVAGLQPGRGHFVSVLRDLDEETEAGLAVADASGLPNRIQLLLLNDAGGVETESERMLLPFGHFAEMFDELWEIEIPRLFNGSIRIEAEHEVGAVAILLKGDQFATLPVRPVVP